jgi:5-oxoprolinase (ATP-hydrolysing) subunit A
MKNKVLDINCDMGESFGNWKAGDDAAVMPKITTANIACGFHASDPVTIMSTVELALANKVAVGAHPGLPDLLGFGRRIMAVSPDDIYAYIAYQVGAVQAFLRAQGATLNHVKPHGAMFHLMRQDDLVEAALDAIEDVAPEAAVYWPGPLGREPFTAKAAARGMRVIPEVYPDLDYTSDGSLIVERQKKPVAGAVIFRRVCQVLTDQELTTSAGNVVPMAINSVCIHGDGPNVSEVLDAVHRAAAECRYRVAVATAMPVAAE